MGALLGFHALQCCKSLGAHATVTAQWPFRVDAELLAMRMLRYAACLAQPLKCSQILRDKHLFAGLFGSD